MAIYIDLHPAPQFDRSLITYCVINFGRIKDGIAQAGKRTYTNCGSTVGPWPANISMDVPFKSDVTIWSQVTFWGTVVAFLATGFRLDGNFAAPYFEMFFNEVGSHKALSATQVIRNVAAGTHTGGIAAITGGIGSDGNDRWRYHYTCYEL